MANYICISRSGDGHYNLARDGFFLDNVKKGDVIMYFYVNSQAVIIGRNQNAWKECNISALERDGIQLVRRHTGGGAVYHDRGNLNFSFIMHESDYDLDRQMRVITSAVESYGVKTERSGRNDVLLDGKKFSGNAYGLAKGNRSHHGTLLVNADLTHIGDYLNVSTEKMRAKGVESVRSRVCNLSEYIPDISIEKVRKAVLKAFKAEYGDAVQYRFTEEEKKEIEARRKVQSSWEWRFGKTPEFDCTVDHRYPFGEVQLHFNLKQGQVRSVKAYSDCLDTSLVGRVEEALAGARFTGSDLASAIESYMLANHGKNEAELSQISDYLRRNVPENM